MTRIKMALTMMVAGLWLAQSGLAFAKFSQELPYCPDGARQTNDTSGMTSFGFRWLRTDGSTCSAKPDTSKNTIFEEGASQTVSISGSNPQDSASLQLSSKEYRTLRTFYIGAVGHYVTEVVSPGHYETVLGTPGYYETVPGTPPSCTTIPGTPGYYDSNGYWVDGTPDRTVCDPGTPATEIWVPGTPDTQVWVPEVDQTVWVQDGTADFYTDTNQYTGDASVAQVQLDFADRNTHPLYPWEDEDLSVNFDGKAVTTSVSKGSYNYDVRTQTENTADGVSSVVTLTPGAKVRTLPDLSAVTGSLGLSPDGQRFSLTLQDKWAQYYQGEDIEIEVKIAVENNWWIFDFGDSNVFTGTFQLRTQSDMVQNLDATMGLKPGNKYDVSFRWHRLNSKISSSDWSDFITLPETQFSPVPAAKRLSLASARRN